MLQMKSTYYVIMTCGLALTKVFSHKMQLAHLYFRDLDQNTEDTVFFSSFTFR